jgi:hypothetical protein
MISLDLYRTTSEGRQCVGTFGDLDVAKAKLTELAETIPGDYSIFDQSTGERLVGSAETGVSTFRGLWQRVSALLL